MSADGSHSAPAVALVPNKADALLHVELLTGSADTPVRIRFLDDAKTGRPATERRGTIEGLWTGLQELQDQHYGVFLIPNADTAAGDFAKDNDVTKIRAAFIDADGIPIPDNWHVDPAFLVHTSPGKWHAYWPVTNLPAGDFTTLQRRLIERYGTDMSIINPARVMRLAGSIHWKDPTAPHLVTIEDRTGGLGREIAEHTTDELRAGLPEVAPTREKIAAHTMPSGIEWDLAVNVDLGKSYLAREVQADRVAHEWQDGNSTLYRVGCQLRDFQLPPARAVELIWENFNPNCVPPWGDQDETFLTPIHRAYADGAAQNIEPGRDAREPSAVVFDHMLTLPANATKADGTGEGRRTKGYRYGELAALPPIKWIVRGLIPERGVGFLSGGPGATKSTTACGLTAAIASGAPALGNPAFKPLISGAGVYVAGEGFYELATLAARGWVKDTGIDLDKHPFYVFPWMPQAASGIGEGSDFAILAGEIREIVGAGNPVSIIVLDTLATMAGGKDENSATDMQSCIDAAAFLVRTFDCFVLIIHHPPKTGTGLRGSGALLGAATTHLELERDGASLITTLTVEKQRGGRTGIEFSMRLDEVDVGPDPQGAAGDRLTAIVPHWISTEAAKEAKAAGDDLLERVKHVLERVRTAHGGALRTGEMAEAAWRLGHPTLSTEDDLTGDQLREIGTVQRALQRGASMRFRGLAFPDPQSKKKKDRPLLWFLPPVRGA